MDHPKRYLLEKIIGSGSNRYKSLRELHAKHVDDLAEVMREYATETVIEVVDHLNKGETVDMEGIILSLGKRKKRA